MQHGKKLLSWYFASVSFQIKIIRFKLIPIFYHMYKKFSMLFLHVYQYITFQSICLYGSLYRTLPLPLCAQWKRSKFR